MTDKELLRNFWSWLTACPVRFEIDDIDGFEGISVAFFPPKDTEDEDGNETSDQQSLVSQVFDQLIQDVKDGDFIAIEELLRSIPEALLRGYLPQETNDREGENEHE